MNDNVWKMLSNKSTEIQKTYENMIDAVKLKIQVDTFDGRKKGN